MFTDTSLFELSIRVFVNTLGTLFISHMEPGRRVEDKARTNPNLAMELANMGWVYAAAWPGTITWGPSPKGLLP